MLFHAKKSPGVLASEEKPKTRSKEKPSKPNKLWKSLSILFTSARPRRLIKEDPDVKSAAWFAKDPSSKWHILANILRLFFSLILAPLYIFIPVKAPSWIGNYLNNDSWFIEFPDTPDAVLYTETGVGEYDAAAPHPQWLLRILFKGDGSISFEQVPWEAALEDHAFKTRGTPYTAISYDMESAYTLFREAGLATIDKVPVNENRRWSLRDRRQISARLLLEYGYARQRAGEEPGVEYIWLDEFCLSADGLEDDTEIHREREHELGQLSDIFRGAKRVCVFCEDIDCDHTTSTCRWGQRLFTIGEIIHAADIIVMTRQKTKLLDKPTTELNFIGERTFKRRMQVEAAMKKKWHLSTIMQHATNSGAMTWQAAIHALVVEAIRRDEASNFMDHRFLGKALNGLLPRRARLEDLKGKNGWEDLAWLLELNQGFYNVSSLAAVCSLAAANVPDYRWWGEPIAPGEGNERLEPLVTSFPVRTLQDGRLKPCLCIMSPRSIPLKRMLMRDSNALWTHEDMRGLKLILHGLLVFIIILVIIVQVEDNPTAIVILSLYFSCMLYVFIDLLVGTIYVVHEGWAYLDDRLWGPDTRKELARQDPDFRENCSEWGERQLVPKWRALAAAPESDKSQSTGTLVDLKNRVFVRTQIVDRPNQLIVLAVHGRGITCLLLKRTRKSNSPSEKVGIVSMPPYIWSQATWSASVYIGGARQGALDIDEYDANSIAPESSDDSSESSDDT